MLTYLGIILRHTSFYFLKKASITESMSALLALVLWIRAAPLSCLEETCIWNLSVNKLGRYGGRFGHRAALQIHAKPLGIAAVLRLAWHPNRLASLNPPFTNKFLFCRIIKKSFF
jgi:hypothetical protein